MLEIAIVIGMIAVGVSYFSIIGFFLYYHNQLFNHMLYEEKWNDGIVFGNNGIEELPDSIKIDDLVE